MHLHLICIFPSQSIDTTDCFIGIIPRQDNTSNGEICHGRSGKLATTAPRHKPEPDQG
jgi:hypothetical protein